MDPQQIASRGWSIIKKIILALIIAAVMIVAIGIALTIYFRINQNAVSRQTYQPSSLASGLPSFSEEVTPEKMIAPQPASAPSASDTITTTNPAIEPKVIKTANLDIQVTDVDQAVSKITGQVAVLSGYIQNSNVSETTTGQKYATVVLRLPAANFEKMVGEIKSLAQLVAKEEINGQEVTQEYIDLQSSLTHNQAVEQQYLDLLKRAGTVDEIIAVRDKLDQVQGEIEQLKGQIRYLDNQTELATIAVNISSEATVTLPANKWQPWEVIKEAAHNLIVGLQNFVNFIIVLIFSLVALIPYLILLFLIYLFVKWLVKKYSKPKQM